MLILNRNERIVKNKPIISLSDDERKLNFRLDRK